MLAYDCTSSVSFENISNWLAQIDQHANTGIEKMLVATKSDKEADRKIDAERGLRLAQEHSMAFFETSALSGVNVNEAFL